MVHPAVMRTPQVPAVGVMMAAPEGGKKIEEQGFLALRIYVHVTGLGEDFRLPRPDMRKTVRRAKAV